MSKEDIKQAIKAVLIDHWCPKQLAENASNILSKYHPDPCLINATDEDIKTVKQAKQYVTEDS